MPKHSKTGVRFNEDDVAAINAGNRILVYGTWMTVSKVKRLNRHPVQLVQIWLDGLETHLVVPLGWPVKIAETVEQCAVS